MAARQRKCAMVAVPSNLLPLDQPVIEITACDRGRDAAPLRPSLDVIFTLPQEDNAFIDFQSEIEQQTRETMSGSKSDIDEESLNSVPRGKLDSLKKMFKELSPKLHRRASKHQMRISSNQSDSNTLPRSKKAMRKLSMQSLTFSKSFDDKHGQVYFSENEENTQKKQNRSHSLGDLLEVGDEGKLSEKHSLISSVKSLFTTPKSDHNKGGLVGFSTRNAKHIRQSSDSLVLDMQIPRGSPDGSRSRKLTLDSNQKRVKPHKVKGRHSHKPIIFIDYPKIGSESSFCLIGMGLFIHDVADLSDFEVQRLELSEVATGISRLKHAESNDHITQMDEKSTLSRIEKLFPHDDLELNSSNTSKPRRRRSAPTQILLRNFRRSTTIADVNTAKLSTASASSAVGVLPASADYVSRKFLFESPVQLSVGVQTQERYLFLFNDLLFIAKQKSATSYKLKNRVLVSDIWIGDNTAEVSEISNLDTTKSFVIGWPTTNFAATFTTKELRDRWKDKLTNQINEELSKEPTAIAYVEVAFRNFDTLTLTVEKNVDARSLLQQTLLAFDIQTDIDSYQLLVLSTKDDSVHPLFGHEQPYTIQMSHERDAEELDANIKCQFILRENKKQMKIDRKPQKSAKKKKMPLASIFRKASGKIPSSPRSNSISEGRIIGHPLDLICNPDIPSPLMELLDNLYNFGPFTTEIFRKPSNAKRCQEMANFMNSTQPEGWCKGCYNGILFASILKMFLRELPGKLCCAEFYDMWSNAINLSKDEDKITTLKKIIERLPKGNQLLLRYIICILSHIQERSSENLMTSYNLAVCLGPSLLWNESSEMSEQEASSKTVPQVIQFLIDQCQAVFGEDILNMFGHPPIPPPDSDTEELEATERIHTPYNDSLESLSDTEAPVMMGALTQMSPSSCSRDSGLILSDPHEDGGEHSDDHSLRQEIIKSKSCDSLSQSGHRNLRTVLSPLQTQVSSDSLVCDDEYIELEPDYNFLLTKSRSGGHLCFDKDAERTPLQLNQRSSNEGLRTRLASLASRYKESNLTQQEVGYSSSDSDKSASNTQASEWLSNDLHKSSTNSSIQQGSSSSDDAINSGDIVTHRHINSPRILESENGYHPTDFLRQFNKKIQNEEAQKKQLRELIRTRTDPAVIGLNTDDTDDDIDQPKQQSPTSASRGLVAHRQPKHSAPVSGSSRITRTNTYAGRTGHKSRVHADVNMVGSMAEMQPIMPQQYRPTRPPPYKEAIERKEKQSGIPEIERIKQTVNSARAKQLYAKSVQLFEQQESSQPSQSRAAIDEIDSSPYSPRSAPTTKNMLFSNLHIDNNNTIGIVNTSDKKIVIKRASSTKLPPRKPSITTDHSSSSIFYQPGVGRSSTQKAPASSSLANSFYRPPPPPYKEVMKRRTSKPDLIDSLGGESLV